jgi:D-alanyl-D-alanine carboxypeptidase/D-alanyl-D-alanine-endopeptidase (penicillin-binding protein 4)
MTIGPDFRMSTRVYEGSAPGSIVLVGGGDPTLSALPPGVESVYKGAPKLSDLAAQVKTAWETNHPGEPITSVVLDASYWDPADKWDSTWERSEQTIGYHSEVTALMVDGDRANPQKVTSPRSTDPIGRAGDAFVAALDLGYPVEISRGQLIPGTPKLGEVKSQPIKTLITQMLPISDNTLAEMIARVVSKEWGGGGTAASLDGIISGVLVNLGLDTTGVVIRDGSGLSAKNAVPPLLVAQLMAKVYTGEQGLGVIKGALPVAGKSGTLASRFTGANAVARGQVVAKTGWINSARTLAGWVTAADGSVLAFAFYALGPVKADAMDALDTVATGVYTCGNNLSNI